MKLSIRPLTPDCWPALEDLFDNEGSCGRCWCAYWRIGSAYRRRTREENKAAFREIVLRGPPPGLLAFTGDLAVGFCQLTPRDALPWLDRAWRLKRVDDQPVWSLSCFYVRKEYRRQGVTAALIAAALKVARRAKARARGVSPGCGSDAQRVVDRLRFDLRARWIQDGRSPRAASADHAP